MGFRASPAHNLGREHSGLALYLSGKARGCQLQPGLKPAFAALCKNHQLKTAENVATLKADHEKGCSPALEG